MTASIDSAMAALLVGAGFALTYMALSTLIKCCFAAFSESEQRPSSNDERVMISDDKARELLERLHTVLSNVGRDVSAHTTQIDVIGQDLAEEEEPTIAKVLEAMERVVQANARLKAQLHEAKATIEEQAHVIGTQIADALTDALTGIANRRAFDQELKRRLAEYRRKQRPFSLILLDADRFKRLNDTYGHVAGDEALKEVAARITSSVREMDLPARYGGEEFGVILPDTCAQDANIVAERIRVAICESPFVISAGRLSVTASCGVTQTVSTDETEASVIQRADEALYASKQAGRNCGHVHDGKRTRPITTANSDERQDSSPDQLSHQFPSATGDGDSCGSEPDNVSPSLFDEATPLPAKEAFMRNVEQRMAELDQRGESVAAILLEIDDYEQVIAEHTQWEPTIARAMDQILRAAIGNTDICARYANHQFATLLCGADLDGAVETASRLRRAVARCESLGDPSAPIRVTVSIGAAESEVGECPDVLLDRLVAAAKAAAHAGGNCVYVHSGGKVALPEEALSSKSPQPALARAEPEGT